MKRYIKSNSAFPNAVREWMHTDEFEDLTSGFTAEELKIWGKIVNSPNPAEFTQAVADVIDVLGTHVTASFDEFLNTLLEKM